MVWKKAASPNLLILWLEGTNGSVTATSIEAALVDLGVLLLRAGPDAAQLRGPPRGRAWSRCDRIPGSALLARNGVGTLSLFDHQRLRPGDIVRHASSSSFVGKSKVASMKSADAAAGALDEGTYLGTFPLGAFEARRDRQTR